jgi:hypothetical protein
VPGNRRLNFLVIAGCFLAMFDPPSFVYGAEQRIAFAVFERHKGKFNRFVTYPIF